MSPRVNRQLRQWSCCCSGAALKGFPLAYGWKAAQLPPLPPLPTSPPHLCSPPPLPTSEADLFSSELWGVSRQRLKVNNPVCCGPSLRSLLQQLHPLSPWNRSSGMQGGFRERVACGRTCFSGTPVVSPAPSWFLSRELLSVLYRDGN